MLLLQALPTSIGAAAIAPALLVLWLVIAADERPGPPARVWLAFMLGAASISLLGIARAPFAAILAVPGNPWMTQALRSVFGVAAPEEIVKVLVIIAVSAWRGGAPSRIRWTPWSMARRRASASRLTKTSLISCSTPTCGDRWPPCAAC